MGLAVAILRGGRTASGTHRFRHAPLQGHGVLNHPVPGARGLKCGEHGLGRARFGGAPRRGAPRGATQGAGALHEELFPLEEAEGEKC